MTIGTTDPVCPCEVLSVVYGEVQVMQRVVRRAVDYFFKRMSGNHVRVVDENTPEVDSNEESEIEVPVQRENVDE